MRCCTYATLIFLGDVMPAKNPRISAVLDVGLWNWLRSKAGREGISVSLVVRDRAGNAGLSKALLTE